MYSYVHSVTRYEGRRPLVDKIQLHSSRFRLLSTRCPWVLHEPSIRVRALVFHLSLPCFALARIVRPEGNGESASPDPD